MGGESVKAGGFEQNLTFEEWKGLYRVHQAVAGKSFCEKAVAYMNFWGWDATDFITLTGLLPKNHSEIIHGKVKRMSIDNALAFCFGLRLPLPLALDLLASAHIALSDGEDDEHLRYLLETKLGAPVEVCNAFLKKNGQPLLGSKTAF